MVSSVFSTSTGSDACTQAVEQCQSTGGHGCEPTTKGFWWSHEENLHATLACATSQDVSLTGSGTSIADEIKTLLPQAQGKDCHLQVFKEEDFIMMPAPDDVVQALGDDEILVRTKDTGTGLIVDVIKGAINVRSVAPVEERSADSEPQLVKKGQRYRHYGPIGEIIGEITTFNREESLASTNIDVLCTFASRQGTLLQVSLCKELGLLTTGPIVHCNREQQSGGQEGDHRTVQMGVAAGVIELEYKMYTVPDQLQIFYEGEMLFDSTKRSGGETVSIPFSGRSSRIEVTVTGNQEEEGTEWEYTIQCPS